MPPLVPWLGPVVACQEILYSKEERKLGIGGSLSSPKWQNIKANIQWEGSLGKYTCVEIALCYLLCYQSKWALTPDLQQGHKEQPLWLHKI